MEVWSEGQRVGELRVRPTNGSSHVEIRIEDDETPTLLAFDPLDLEPTTFSVERVALRIVKRRVRIDDRDLERLDCSVGNDAERARLLWERYGIPPDASMMRNPAEFSRVFFWSVLELTPAEVEKVFDLEIFEPAEFGPPDYDRRMTDMGWMAA